MKGKQLVFLFMAATVVVVVIFLCGVMVGRGVPVARSAEAAELAAGEVFDPTDAAQPSAAAVASTSGGPLTAGETLTYADRLQNPNPPAETLKPASEIAAARSEMPAEPVEAVEARMVERQPGPVRPAARPESPRAPEPATPSFAEPRGRGYVVQVAAVRKRAEAETIARRLSAKGYPSFVTTSGANFRVRVGRFDSQSAAASAAARLQREEQFNTWITR